MKKCLLSWLMVLTLCLTLLPTAAFAAEDAPEQTQPVSEERQENAPAGEQETPAPGEEQPAPEEEQEDPAPEEDGEEQSASETKQPAAAPAAEPALLAAASGIATYSGDDHTSHPICGNTGCSDHTENVTWTAIGSENELRYNMEAGSENAPKCYYLTADITLNGAWSPKNGTVLCLNGKTITQTGSGDDNVITVSGTFTLCDCQSTQGEITHGTDQSDKKISGRGVAVGKSGTFNLYGGSISGNELIIGLGYGGGVYVDGGTFNLYGGSVTENVTACGGGVYVDKGTFNMSGGSVSGNAVFGYKKGGGVYVNGGTFNLYGGSIADNRERDEAHSGSGGGVYVTGTNSSGTFNMFGGSISGDKVTNVFNRGGGVYVDYSGTFNMSGGTISGNAIAETTKSTSIAGGGVYVTPYQTTFIVSGDAVISGNKLGSEANNVYLPSDKDKTITVSGELNDGARIGVTVAGNFSTSTTIATLADDLSLTEDAAAKTAAKFVSDQDSYCGKLSSDGSVKLATAQIHKHCLCGKDNCTDSTDSSKHGYFSSGTELRMEADGSLWAGNTVLNKTYSNYKNYYELADNNYYLGNDLNLKYPIYITEGTVGLCLNGHSITLEDDGYAIEVAQNCTFNLCDCKGGGKITHADGKKGSGVNLEKASNSGKIIFNMYGGSITGNTATSGGGVYVGGGTFNMYGGAITGNAATDNGGVYVSESKFNMYGGMIGDSTTESANSASNGGGVYVAKGGEFTMSGGTISGNAVANATSSTAEAAGGGVYVILYSSVFKVSGNVNITGNKVGDVDNNVYLSSDETGMTAKTITIDGTLDGAKIGVTTSLTPTAGSPVKFATGASENDTQYFTHDAKTLAVSYNESDKALYLKAHQHEWKYTNDGPTAIKITCGADGCNLGRNFSVTYTLTAPTDLTYNGEGKPAKINSSAVEIPTGVSLPSIPTIEYTPAVSETNAVPTDAGDYTASITLGGVTASVTYEIKKATPTADDFVFSAPGNLIYDGNHKSATVRVADGVRGMGNAFMYYYDENGDMAVGTANVGTYTVKLNVGEGANYNAIKGLTGDDWTFTIQQNTTAPDVTLSENYSLTYNKNQLTPPVTVKIGDTTLVKDEDYTVSYGDNINAGTDAGTVTIKAKGNYGFTDKTVKFTISQREVTITGITVDNKVYNGTTAATTNVSTAVITGKVDGDDLTVNPGTAAFADKNVGTGKTVTFSGYSLGGSAASNYTLSNQPASVTADITAKDVTLTSGINATDRSYVKDNKTVDLTKGTLTFTGLVSGETLDVNIPATGTISDAKVGTYNVTYSGVTLIDGTGEAGNYKLVSPLPTVTVNITKATYVGTKNANGSAKYGASGTVDLSSLIAEGGTAAYKSVADTDSVLNGTPAMSADGKTLNFAFADNAANAAKTADIVVEVTSANYLPYEITVTVTVNDKTTPVVTAPTAIASLEYNGSEQVLITAGSTTGGTTMQYSLTSGGGYSTDIPTATNAGTYAVYYKVVGNDDYADVPEAYISVTIAKKAVTVAPKAFTITKGSAIPTFELVYTGLVSGESLTPSVTPTFTCYETGTTPVSASTAAGTYNITWTNKDSTNFGTTNYDVTKVATGTLTINNPTSTGGGSSGPRIIKTETTTNPDGSTTKTETWSDGMVTEATTNPDGSTTKTTTKKDGSSVTESKDATGTTGTVKTDKDGKTEAEAKVSEKAVEDAKKSGEAVKVPTEVKAGEDSNSAPTVKVELPKNAGETKIEIPVSDVNSGTVAIIVHPDGTEEIVKDSKPTEDGVQLTVDGSATIKIIDNSKDFIDTRDHWSRDEVNFVASREIFNGVGGNSFGVNQPMTRGMVNTVLARLAGIDTTPKNGQKWYEVGTAWAKSQGITDGTNPEASVTREQLATLLYRFYGSPAVSGTLSFADAGEVSDYARSALLWATQNGILNGVGNNRVAPGADAQRAQVAAMMARYLKNVG